MKESRFYTQDPNIPIEPEIMSKWYGVVDDEAGGIIAIFRDVDAADEFAALKEATMPEPLAMTLEEALIALGRKGMWLEWGTAGFSAYMFDDKLDEDGSMRMVAEWAKTWPEAASAALGRPVVERDDKAELVEALKRLSNKYPTYPAPPTRQLTVATNEAYLKGVSDGRLDVATNIRILLAKVDQELEDI